MFLSRPYLFSRGVTCARLKQSGKQLSVKEQFARCATSSENTAGHAFIRDVGIYSTGEDFAIIPDMSLYTLAGVTVGNDVSLWSEYNTSNENGSYTVSASLELSVFCIFRFLSAKKSAIVVHAVRFSSSVRVLALSAAVCSISFTVAQRFLWSCDRLLI